MSHHEATTGEIMESIGKLDHKVGTLSESVGELTESVGELTESVGELTESVGYIIGFLQEHVMTKAEIYTTFTTKQETMQFKDEILNAIDASSKVFIRLDQEQAATSHQVDGLRDRTGKIEHHLGLAV